MNTAKVVSTGRVTTPESGRDALQVITDLPYAVGGQHGPWTAFYLVPSTPPIMTGAVIEWDHHSATVDGRTYDRLHGEDEFDPNAPLH